MKKLIFILGFVANIVLLNAQDLNEQLFSAVKNGNIDSVKLLIDKGADVNARDKDGITPFDAASRGSNFKVAAYLITRGSVKGIVVGIIILVVSITSFYGQTELAKLLIENGAY